MAACFVGQLLGRQLGPSTGTNFAAVLTLAHEMRERGEQGSVLSLICDGGERYQHSYHDPAWVQSRFGQLVVESPVLTRL